MTAKRAFKKLGKFLAMTGVGLGFGLSATTAYLEQSNQQGLREVKMQMKADGLPLEPAELQAPLPPAAENAAPLYVQLTQLLKAKPLAAADMLLSDPTRTVPPSAERIAQIRIALQHRQDILQLVHKAALRPKCVFTRNYALGPDLMLPEYAAMRSGMRILTSESQVLLADGKPLDAIRNQTLGFHMAQHAAADPLLIAKLVGIAINSITLRFMESVLYTAGGQHDVAHAVANTIAQNWKSVDMADGMRGEIVLGEVVCDMLRKGKPIDDAYSFKFLGVLGGHTALGKALIDANELDVLRCLQMELPMMKQPYAAGKIGLETLSRNIESRERTPTHLLAAILSPVFEQALSKQAQGEAQAATVRASAQVLDYYHQKYWVIPDCLETVVSTQHEVFPDRLETVVSPLPLDPFGKTYEVRTTTTLIGMPLHYQREGNGFCIYSVGPTGEFNGGTTLHKPDSNETVFHFPMPAYFQQK